VSIILFAFLFLSRFFSFFVGGFLTSSFWWEAGSAIGIGGGVPVGLFYLFIYIYLYIFFPSFMFEQPTRSFGLFLAVCGGGISFNLSALLCDLAGFGFFFFGVFFPPT